MGDQSTREAMEIQDLYERFGPMVMRRCRQLLRDEDEALDVTQDVFVRVLERRDRLDLNSPSSLLYRIATNLCLNRMRHQTRFPKTSDEKILFQLATTDDLEERLSLQSVLSWLFRRQPESTRTIAVLHYLDGLTLEETALEVGLSVSGVRKRLRRLRSTLKGFEHDEN
ncbi:RNA polymerase sigma factor [Candidatus Eisenbacteria bacterium]|uniref:RNA polymerase sigma factor n=1 Tax=Eiseniibacteriota bacterium TaxID=2212470 RepID=A0ABV6YJ07_UNCEI